ncbi:hypothetical protein PIN31115_02834 [Pandoraea iniqua]|uniref:Uncharacterized protein n=1 Tax=Pandoraea iniqua TaxID=2508288 RepID=A0A5E4VUG4_9BURK|nr:hypothetical protein [Pandoraea iniqua]VVE15146.1 hypothetical protein PIN31115_02834 [Pandoraea iniqua]
MRRKFVVLHKEMSEDQQKDFLAWLKDERVGWWHWLPGSWLIVDPDGQRKAEHFRNKLTALGVERSLIFEVSDTTANNWAGRGPNGTGKNMFKWVKENWLQAPKK